MGVNLLPNSTKIILSHFSFADLLLIVGAVGLAVNIIGLFLFQGHGHSHGVEGHGHSHGGHRSHEGHGHSHGKLHGHGML